jgi:hypothetical protein
MTTLFVVLGIVGYLVIGFVVATVCAAIIQKGSRYVDVRDWWGIFFSWPIIVVVFVIVCMVTGIWSGLEWTCEQAKPFAMACIRKLNPTKEEFS